jgi:hypothetical protein
VSKQVKKKIYTLWAEGLVCKLTPEEQAEGYGKEGWARISLAAAFEEDKGLLEDLLKVLDNRQVADPSCLLGISQEESCN